MKKIELKVLICTFGICMSACDSKFDQSNHDAGSDGPSSSASEVIAPTGLKYQDVRLGAGPMPQAGQTVTVNYEGRFKDGTKFDSSYDRGSPFSFKIGVGEVIRGWDEGVATMKVGGKRELIIPPQLAYGDKGAGGVIPPNSELRFTVELISIQ